MIDLDESIRAKPTNDGHWDNYPECARLLLKHSDLRKDWKKEDYLALARSIRAEYRELAEMLSTI